MKVETRELPDSEVEFSFEVEDARVERAMDAAYRRASGRVNIAGFRRGKAPRALVERVIGRESLLEEALNELLPQVYEEALRDSNVQALTEPHFDVESFTPLRAKATVVVQPPVELGDYRSIAHEAEPVTVSEEDVDNVLQSLRESHAEWVPVERPAELGDRVSIDVKGVAEERSIIDQDDVEYLLRAENPAPVPGFAEQIVGMSAGGDRTFTLAIPEDADEADLAGKPIEFQVKANDVKAKELPELDDYFATTVGTYTDLVELRTRIEEQLRQQAEFGARRKLENDVLEEAVSSTTVVVPEKLVAQHAERARERLAGDLDTQGLSIEQYLQITSTSEDDFEARLRTDGERALKQSFVLRAIAAAEGLEVSEDDVDLGIRAALAEEGGDARTLNRALRQPEIRDRMRAAMLEQAAARWLIERALGPESSVDETAAEVEGEQEA